MTSKITVNYPSGIIETEVTTTEEFATKMKSIATLMFNSPCEITFNKPHVIDAVTTPVIAPVTQPSSIDENDVPSFDVKKSDVFHINVKINMYTSKNEGSRRYSFGVPAAFIRYPNKWKYIQCCLEGANYGYTVLISKDIIQNRTTISIPCHSNGYIDPHFLLKWTTAHRENTFLHSPLNGKNSHSTQKSLDA